MTAWTKPESSFEQVRSTVLSMPAAQRMGFQIGVVTSGAAELILPYRRELTDHQGAFRIGVIAALADFAGMAAAGTVLPTGWDHRTVQITVDVVDSTKGERLIARGRVVTPSDADICATVDVFAVDRAHTTMCATASLTMRKISPSPIDCAQP